MQDPDSKNIETSSDKNYTSIIEWIKIYGLFGSKDIHIDLTDRCRILIGYNGLGKTTILKIVNELLEGNIEKLKAYQIEKVSIKFESISYPISFDKDEIINIETAISESIKSMSEKAYETTLNKLSTYDEITLTPQQNGNYFTIGNRNNYKEKPLWITQSFLNFYRSYPYYFQLRKLLSKLNFKVIYLPSFRRIEATLDDLINDHERLKRVDAGPVNQFSNVETRVLTSEYFFNDIKHLKFGMEDIQSKIDAMLNQISNESLNGYTNVAGKTISYLLDDGDSKEEIIYDEFNENEVKIILDRVKDNLSENQKNHIIELIKTGEIKENPNLIYFINKLLEAYKGLKKWDFALKGFEEACNEFLYDKSFFYDESNFALRIQYKKEQNNNESFNLNQLSSGEKQIVSLMASLFLETDKNLVVIIDEPEISISIDWQKKLLPTLLKANSCKLLLAVTHSPFIFENELLQNTKGPRSYVSDRN